MMHGWVDGEGKRPLGPNRDVELLFHHVGAVKLGVDLGDPGEQTPIRWKGTATKPESFSESPDYVTLFKVPDPESPCQLATAVTRSPWRYS